MKKGTVYLIGAGPGDPELLTIRAKNLLQKADVVIYDRLVNKEILSSAPEDAEYIYAGKEPGHHYYTQDEINKLLVQKALQGGTVVRLKGGDPFLFGRGGEEAEYLSQHKCGFEVVPGITSAIAAPAYAGIPVTHRNLASSFAVITGHEMPGKQSGGVFAGKSSGDIDTLVFVMAMENLSSIVEQLIKHGKSSETPVALVRYGTLPEQGVITGTLASIVKKAERTAFKPPAVFVVGEVVTLREKLNWFEKKPLWGKKVLVTRPKAQAESFVSKIAAIGAEAVRFPAITINKEPDLGMLHHAFKKIESFDWIIFTSSNGVDIFFDELAAQNMDARALKGIKICAIGPATKSCLGQRGLLADVVPERYCCEGIIDVLKGKLLPGQKALLPRARRARPLLTEELKAGGVNVKELTIYEAFVPKKIDNRITEMIIKGDIDIITFTSSSSVRNFASIVGKRHIKTIDSSTQIACIGPITADTASACGFSVDIEAKVYTVDGLIDAIT